MKKENAVSRAYTTAHVTQYTILDLRKALDMYRKLLLSHPDTKEADYSRSQVQNIVRAVVPDRDLYTVLIDLALNRLGESTDSPVSSRAGATGGRS